MEVLKISQGCHTCKRNATNNHKSRVSSSFSSNASDEEEIFQSGPGQQVQTPSSSQWTGTVGNNWAWSGTANYGWKLSGTVNNDQQKSKIIDYSTTKATMSKTGRCWSQWQCQHWDVTVDIGYAICNTVHCSSLSTYIQRVIHLHLIGYCILSKTIWFQCCIISILRLAIMRSCYSTNCICYCICYCMHNLHVILDVTTYYFTRYTRRRSNLTYWFILLICLLFVIMPTF